MTHEEIADEHGGQGYEQGIPFPDIDCSNERNDHDGLKVRIVPECDPSDGANEDQKKCQDCVDFEAFQDFTFQPITILILIVMLIL